MNYDEIYKVFGNNKKVNIRCTTCGVMLSKFNKDNCRWFECPHQLKKESFVSKLIKLITRRIV